MLKTQTATTTPTDPNLILANEKKFLNWILTFVCCKNDKANVAVVAKILWIFNNAMVRSFFKEIKLFPNETINRLKKEVQLFLFLLNGILIPSKASEN